MKLVFLNDPESHEMGPLLDKYENLNFLGLELDDDTAKKIADCEIEPNTHKSLKEIARVR
jgi:hypothetical protein